MLLLNSLFAFIIRKFATYYALKPPCFWCSTIDHLVESNDDINPFHNLVCEAHAAEFLNHYYCPDRLKVTTEPCHVFRNEKCTCCSMNFEANSVEKLSSKMKSPYEENEMIGVVDLPIENNSRYIQVFDQIIPLEWTDSSTSCSRGSSLNGEENMVIMDEDQVQYQGCELKEDKAVTVASLMAELKSERLAVSGLHIELEEERNAAAVAANQAMAMITRLQEEKVALQIESMQSQRIMDEQADYDQKVLKLLNELVMKLEDDKFELENQLEIYKEKLLDYNRKEKAKMMHRVTKKSLDETNVKNSKTLEESIVEFEVARLWILDELEELDETLMMLTNDLDEDLVGKVSLEGEQEHLSNYKRNILMEDIDEDDEASHSVWPVLEITKRKRKKN